MGVPFLQVLRLSPRSAAISGNKPMRHKLFPNYESHLSEAWNGISDVDYYRIKFLSRNDIRMHTQRHG